MTEENGMMQFEIVKRVTLPFLILEGDKTYYLKFDTAFEPDTTSFSERVRAQKTPANGEPVKQEPIDIATVTDLQSGEICRLVGHAVLKSNIEDVYKDKSYVGRLFQIKRSKDRFGKGTNKHFRFNIDEIKLKTADQKNVAAGGKK